MKTLLTITLCFVLFVIQMNANAENIKMQSTINEELTWV